MFNPQSAPESKLKRLILQAESPPPGEVRPTGLFEACRLRRQIENCDLANPACSPIGLRRHAEAGVVLNGFVLQADLSSAIASPRAVTPIDLVVDFRS